MLTLDTLNEKLAEATDAFIENQKAIGEVYASKIRDLAAEAEKSPIDEGSASALFMIKGVELETRLNELMSEIFEE